MSCEVECETQASEKSPADLWDQVHEKLFRVFTRRQMSGLQMLRNGKSPMTGQQSPESQRVPPQRNPNLLQRDRSSWCSSGIGHAAGMQS